MSGPYAGALADEECRLVEGRFSLFRPFAEAPFFGFRGVVARSGSEFRVTVAAEMDMYPNYVPWVFVTPPVAGANRGCEAPRRYHLEARDLQVRGGDWGGRFIYRESVSSIQRQRV